MSPIAKLCLCTVALALNVGVAQGSVATADADFDADSIVTLLELVIDADADSARRCLTVLAQKSQTGEISPQQVQSLRRRLGETLNEILRDHKHALFPDAAVLSATWNEPAGRQAARTILFDVQRDEDQRLAACGCLITRENKDAIRMAATLLGNRQTNSAVFRGGVISALGRLDRPDVADVVLAAYPDLEDELKPRAIQLLTQRVGWGKSLLAEIRAKRILADALNVNQVKQLIATGDPDIARDVTSIWGAIRSERDEQREAVVDATRRSLQRMSSDPFRGQAVFARVCAQCHKIYGQGQDVGPDITGNGRASFEQLLSNILDPSLVIGQAYQARTVVTVDGRVLTGLPVEDSQQRIVLKTQGGKLETIPREDVDAVRVSKLSLMPEGLERQLKPQELADLIAFLSLDRPPADPAARPIPGTPTR